MRMNIMLMILLLSAFLYADYYIGDVDLSPSVLEENEHGILMITIVNNDPSNSVEGLRISLSWPAYVIADNLIAIGDLAPGGKISYSIPFKIRKNITEGKYKVGISVYGLVGVEKTMKVLSTSSILTLIKPPLLDVSFSDSNVNEITDVRLVLNNYGGLAKKVFISIPSSSKFALVGSDRIYIPFVKNSSEIDLKLDSRAVEEGPHKLPLTFDYEDTFGNSYSENRTISLIVRKESGDFIFSQDHAIITGRDDDLVLNIKNDGNSISNLRISMGDHHLQLVGKSEILLNNLPKGSMKSVSLKVHSDAKPGTVLVPFNLKWVENNEEMSSVKYVPIKVASDVEVGIYLEGKPLPYVTDGDHSLSIIVSNKGSYPIEAVSVKLSSDIFDIMNLEDEQYIGGLTADDFSSVQFQVHINSISPGVYPVNISVSYRDASGDLIKKNITRMIKIHSAQNDSSGISSVLIGVIIVSVIVIYWYMRKRR